MQIITLLMQHDPLFVLNEDALNKFRDDTIPDHLIPEYKLLFSQNTLMSNNQRAFLSNIHSVPRGIAFTAWIPCSVVDPSKITEDILNQYRDEQLQRKAEIESREPKSAPIDDPL